MSPIFGRSRNRRTAALMLWKQPRQTLKLAAAILVLVAVGYAVSGIMDFVMSSMTTKELMVEPGK